jgi:hypothetical protein
MGHAFVSRRLKEFLRERLIASGWRDELKESCKEVIRKKGLDKITIEELVAEITPKGRGEATLLPICAHISILYTFILSLRHIL